MCEDSQKIEAAKVNESSDTLRRRIGPKFEGVHIENPPQDCLNPFISYEQQKKPSTKDNRNEMQRV